MKVDGIEVRTIPGFSHYGVTRDGRVWVFFRRDKRHRPSGGRFLRLKVDKVGRCGVTLSNKGCKYSKRIHRLVLETFVGPCPEGMECRHLNGNPKDNRLDNLCWGTPKENQADRLTHGTDLRGEKSPNSKLTASMVRLIFNAYHDGAYTVCELVKEFKVSKSTIWAILNKKSWKHLWAKVA